jgi:hypothetical protein
MLSEPPHPRFNITHVYALFTSILCWTMQRMRKKDGRGRSVQSLLRTELASADPWLLPLNEVSASRLHLSAVTDHPIPALSDWPIEPFLIGLRNAVAHSDGRCVQPENHNTLSGPELIGFRFTVEAVLRKPTSMPHIGRSNAILASMSWKGDLLLKENDMRRIGKALADRFCHAMTGKVKDTQQQANASLREAAA